MYQILTKIISYTKLILNLFPFSFFLTLNFFNILYIYRQHCQHFTWISGIQGEITSLAGVRQEVEVCAEKQDRDYESWKIRSDYRRQTDRHRESKVATTEKVSHEKKYSKTSHLYAMLYNVLIYSSVSIRDKKIFKKYTGNSSD